MAKGKAHERGLARARERRRQQRHQARRRRWVSGVAITVIVLMVAVAAVALLPDGSPSPVVEGAPTDSATERPTSQAASPGEASPGAAVACGAEAPTNAEQQKPSFNEPPSAEIDPAATYRATITTSCGDIVVDLFADRSPKTVENFVALAQMDYYAGVIFHRVIEGFVIQAGDPTGTGAGDPGYTIEGELEAAEDEGYRRGIIAMANKGGDPSTASTQFFIVQGQQVGLPPQYAVFGEVVEGMDVVDTIAAIETSVVGGQPDVPTETVFIENVTIEQLPASEGAAEPTAEESP